MPLLVSYSFRSAFARKLTTGLTIFGIALVVFVFCAVLMLSHGLKETLVDTGSVNNAIVVRRSATTEIVSILSRDMADIVKADPAIAADVDGSPMFANEILVLINQPKRSSDEPSNVPVRGVSDKSDKIRPNFRIIEGRRWHPGISEIIAGVKVAETFQGCGLGETVRFGTRDWTVVGVFESGGSAFESELWGDIDQMMDAFQRPVFSSFTMQLAPTADFDQMKSRLEEDPRLTADIFTEKDYYRRQSAFTTTFIEILGLVISIIFSMGAVVGAMITMYASVSNRTTEIGTLRALGFSRFSILSAFLIEAVIIALVGGAIGILAAQSLTLMEVSTTNWDTFAELGFGFRMSSAIALEAIFFSILMGVIGGFLPAVAAARMRVINALYSR